MTNTTNCEQSTETYFYFYFLVDEGAILDVQFNAFYHQPPIGFDRILLEKSIL